MTRFSLQTALTTPNPAPAPPQPFPHNIDPQEVKLYALEPIPGNTHSDTFFTHVIMVPFQKHLIKHT